MLSYPKTCRFSIGVEVQEIKNYYLPIVQPFTTKSVTFIPITTTNRQDLGISRIELLPNVQLIKRLVA
jgi:hypothetical protein